MTFVISLFSGFRVFCIGISFYTRFALFRFSCMHSFKVFLES